MNTSKALFRLCLFLAVAAWFLSATAASAAGTDAATALLSTYQRIEGALVDNGFGFPLYLDSSDEGGRVSVNVYGVLDYSFGEVSGVLKVPASLCDIAALHPNVKACTYAERNGTTELVFYNGRKYYETPEDAHQFRFRYRRVGQQKGYLDIMLSAEEGPFGTADHRMTIEAVPLPGGKTFLHVGCSYRYGSALRLVEKIYFATLGRGKVGFSVTGTDDYGNPLYVDGPRGAVERTAVRYYFAIQSFLDTLQVPEESRFSARAAEWYDLTSRYRRQLYVMDREDYLKCKAGERQNQIALQKKALSDFR